MSGLLRGLRSVAASLAGYAVIVVGTILTFEIWLGGFGYYESPPGELVLGSFGAALSGLAGGLVAGLVAGRRPLLHALGVLVFLVLDTTYVLASGISSDPLWFDLGGTGTLMVTALLGGWLLERRAARRAGSSAT